MLCESRSQARNLPRLPPMTRATVLLTVLLPLSFSAYADWSYLGPLPAGGDAYLDLASRSQADGRSRIRLLANYSASHAERDGTSIRSSTSVQEFECATRRAHLLERRVHEGPFAQGVTRVTPVRDDPWRDVPPGSRGESVLAVACPAWTLVDAPTNDWAAQPLVPGSPNLRYDRAHTQHHGQRLTLRWMMEQAPDGLQPPAGHSAASTEAEMDIDCDRRRILSTVGIGHSEASGRGSAVTISARTQEDALDDSLPAPLAALARRLCAAP